MTPLPQPARRVRDRLARARGALAAIAVGTLVLTGCAQAPGTAAVVEGRVVADRDVQRTVQDLTEMLPNPLAAEQVLVGLIVGPFFVDAAAEHGVGVSDDEARALATQIAAGQEREVGELGRSTIDLLKFSLASEELSRLPDGAEIIRGIEEQVFSADIEVSPRYGEFTETGQIVAPSLPWIGEPQA